MSTRYEDFIQFAIEQEVLAAQAYEKYAGIVQSRTARQVLTDMAAMERGHEARLREFLQTGMIYISKKGEINDMHISDFMVDQPISQASAVEQVFIFAMKAEDKACQLYQRLAALETDSQIKKLFESMASEERKHKYDLETEYERMFMTEN